MSKLPKSVSTATSRLAQVSQQFSSQAPLRQQQARMAHKGTMHKLNTGASIPALGFGTWQDKEAQEPAVVAALQAGVRHIDTAAVYGTEPAVGSAIKKSGVPRSEIFLVTKIWNNSHAPEDVEAALDTSLSNLGTDYVDLWYVYKGTASTSQQLPDDVSTSVSEDQDPDITLPNSFSSNIGWLMHWPSAFASGSSLFPKDSNGKVKAGSSDYVETYKAMEKLYKSGKARAIGVSNFSKAEMERLIKETSVVPAVHQLELHPYLQQHEFAEWHRSQGIHVTQYSPFGNSNEVYSKGQNLSKLIEDPTLVEVGKKYGKSGAQVALAWGIAHGRSVIPKSKTPARIQQNVEGDFELKLRFNDPSANFGWNFYQDLDGKEA
ncbi:unnamed protein product [Aureobasidium vineae]|uniref:NADP-dependent oxidoreductase domain-containing protein n=1 Tax=Aureobasidium vineae TaxID=2773715 RepID=A0A9N8P5S8_9PEZI|nr:unnamed protein product [Aureobasidium vineae]